MANAPSSPALLSQLHSMKCALDSLLKSASALFADISVLEQDLLAEETRSSQLAARTITLHEQLQEKSALRRAEAISKEEKRLRARSFYWLLAEVAKRAKERSDSDPSL